MSSDGPEYDDPRCPGCGNSSTCTCPTLTAEYVPVYEARQVAGCARCGGSGAASLICPQRIVVTTTTGTAMVSGSTPTQQVAAILREHYHHATCYGPMCWCGVKVGINEHPEHVAEVLLDALQLTEEWTVITDMGVGPHRPLTEERARRMAKKYDDMEARSRLVGPWRETEC